MAAVAVIIWGSKVKRRKKISWPRDIVIRLTPVMSAIPGIVFLKRKLRTRVPVNSVIWAMTTRSGKCGVVPNTEPAGLLKKQDVCLKVLQHPPARHVISPMAPMKTVPPGDFLRFACHFQKINSGPLTGLPF